MTIIGLIIAAAAAALTADVAYETTGNVSFNAFNRGYTMSGGWAVIIAVLIGAVGMLGLGLLFGGVRRARRRRAVIVERRRNAADLEGERDRLAAELENERAARAEAEARARSTAGDSGEVVAPARSRFDMTPSSERTDA